MPSMTPATNFLTRIAVLMSCLATLKTFSVKASLNTDEVDKYVLTRRGWKDSDLYEVIYKTGHKRHKHHKGVCQNTSTWVNNTASCCCSCKADTRFFLLETGSFTDTAVITRNPVVEIYDQIPIERPIDRSSTSSEQDSQSTYQGLVNNSGKNNGGSIYSNSEDNNGYCHVYQSVDKNKPISAASVYQNVPTSVKEPDYQNVQTLEGGTPYASVYSPGSQTESAYEPLKGSDSQNLYEPLNKRNN